jgi:hypothetical protein
MHGEKLVNGDTSPVVSALERKHALNSRELSEISCSGWLYSLPTLSNSGCFIGTWQQERLRCAAPCTFLCCFVASSSGRGLINRRTGEIRRQLALWADGERRGEVSNVQVKSVLHASPFSQRHNCTVVPPKGCFGSNQFDGTWF